MREKILRTLAEYQYKRTWQLAVFFMIITLLMGFLASRLKTTMRWSDLLPEKDPVVQEMDHVIREFSTESSIVVVIQGDENRIKEFAERVVPEVENITHEQTGQKLIKRIDYRQETEFLRQFGLLLFKEKDLLDMEEFFSDPNTVQVLTNINNLLEKEYVGKEGSITGREKRDRTISYLNGLQHWLETMDAFLTGRENDAVKVTKSMEELLMGDPYFLSYDQRALILNIIPTFSSIELDKIIYTVDQVEFILKEKAKQYPGIQVGLTGSLALSRDEMVASQQSLNLTSIITLIGIFRLLAMAFRMWLAPVFALFTLVIGVIWATAMAYLSVGILNIMTSMMAVILFGLGIDFSIHLLAAFTEERSLGKGIKESLQLTYVRSGKGIITGALTTAAAFFCLVISETRGMKEMGIVTSLGLLTILLVTFVFLPLLIIFREKRKENRHYMITTKDISFGRLGALAQQLAKYKFTAFLLFLVITVFMGYQASKLEVDYNYLNMEPKGLESVALWDTLTEKFDLTMDYALVVATSVDESRQLKEKAKTLSTVAIVEDISNYLPSMEEQNRRIPIILRIKNRLHHTPIREKLSITDLQQFFTELDRLQMNLMEIQDLAYLQGEHRVEQKCAALVGDPENSAPPGFIPAILQKWQSMNPNLLLKRFNTYHSIFAPCFLATVSGMCSGRILTLDNLPPSVLSRYTNDRKDQFLVTIYPRFNIWKDARYLKSFSADMNWVSSRVTGMAPIMNTLFDIIVRDGKIALLLTLILVFFLLVLDFRSVLYALFALVPLGAGLIWMAGLMKLSGMMLTVVNIMGLPLILGIGIDDGVHILHRFREEREGNLYRIFASTGRAILLTSLTTMLAFGSLVFSIYRGFASFGSALFLGVGACFVTTVWALPPLLQFFFIERRENRKV